MVNSSIARESDTGSYTHAGPEIGVASTKAFTTQMTVLYLMAVKLSKSKELFLSRFTENIFLRFQELIRKFKVLLASNDIIKSCKRK